jgi:multisubunit Na+/H+ antiporter MnhE subunit
MAEKATTRRQSGEQRVTRHTALLVLLLSAGLWLLFTGSTRLDEWLVGVPAVVLSAWFLCFVLRTESPVFEPSLSDVFACWRAPWYFVVDTCVVLRVLVQDLLGRRALSLYRFCGFETSTTDARLIARGVLATAYTTATPNTIVLGIDPAQSRMIFHQLERASVPAMTKQLGARVAAERQQ